MSQSNLLYGSQLSESSIVSCSFDCYKHKRLEEEFDDISEIGSGGFGQVWKARRKLEKRDYAIKMIPFSNQKNGEITDEVKIELDIITQLHHGNVVRYYNSWTDNAELKTNNISTADNQNYKMTEGEVQPKLPTILYIQMEFCAQTLRHSIDQKLLITDFPLTRKLFQEMLNGLDYIHSKGIIHRDIKPENIFVTDNKEVKIGDFGLSTLIVKNEFGCLLPKSCVGTALYMAPEIRNNQNESYNEKCDVYSLGVVLFEMICPPFTTFYEKNRVFSEFLSIENLSKQFLAYPDNFGMTVDENTLTYMKTLLKAMLNVHPLERPQMKSVKEIELAVHNLHGQFYDRQMITSSTEQNTERNTQTMVWEENFNCNSLNRSVFSFNMGRENNGWGNKELQYCTDRSKNARVEDSILIIETHREHYLEKSEFTSARLITKSLMEFKYGTLEARIKLPSQKKGLWPAFWTLGSNIDEVGWPNCGEINILETGSADAIAKNVVNNLVGGAVHWENGAMYNTVHKAAFDLSANFHIYKLTWTSSVISVSLDNREYFRMNISSDALRKPHFLILNLAIGGDYPNIHNPDQIDADFPAQMQIDYIRLYQSPGDVLIVNDR